jgi:hypothetical protein
VLHLVADLLVALLLVAGRVAVHLVHADDELAHAQQVDQARVLAGLALDLTGLVVTLGGFGKKGRKPVSILRGAPAAAASTITPLVPKAAVLISV